MIDQTPQATFYFSDLMPTYKALIYTSGQHTPMLDKSQTFQVEGHNVEIQHYLARLARRSRCFSRCIRALTEAIKLFVFAWNRHQLYRHAILTISLISLILYRQPFHHSCKELCHKRSHLNLRIHRRDSQTVAVKLCYLKADL